MGDQRQQGEWWSGVGTHTGFRPLRFGQPYGLPYYVLRITYNETARSS